MLSRMSYPQQSLCKTYLHAAFHACMVVTAADSDTASKCCDAHTHNAQPVPCRASISMSRTGSHVLDDDLLEATAQAAGMAVKQRRSGAISPSLQHNRDEPGKAPALEPAGAGQGQPGPSRHPALTMEDSAELSPARGGRGRWAAGRPGAGLAGMGGGGARAAPAPKAPQPRCGCTIC